MSSVDAVCHALKLADAVRIACRESNAIEANGDCSQVAEPYM
jgi:hypothetical protein